MAPAECRVLTAVRRSADGSADQRLMNMNVTLWIVQVLLALHTFVGAFWKFSNSEQGVTSLKTLPHGVWLAMIGVELLCSVGLVLPLFSPSLRKWAPIAAICIGAEMVLFSAVFLLSGAADYHEITYWLIVAAFCAFIAYGRLVLRPGTM